MCRKTTLFLSMKSIMGSTLTDEEITVLELYGKHIGMNLLTELTYEEQQIFIEHIITTLKPDFDEFEKYKDMDVAAAAAEVEIKEIMPDLT